MRKELVAALRSSATGDDESAKRRQLVAWSRAMDESGIAKSCGIVRVDGRTAQLTTFMFVPDGDMETEDGDVIRVDAADLALTFIGDVPMEVEGVNLSGTRWRGGAGADDLYLFVAWNPKEHPNQEGEIIATDRAFESIEDRWPVTSSFWLK